MAARPGLGGAHAARGAVASGIVTTLPQLSPEEQRVLGCLLEKEVTVPATYPLTLGALRTACNQSSNREPVVDYDERTIQDAVRALKEHGFARVTWLDYGRRTLKYAQSAAIALALDDDERALLTVLLLRGPQAPGELKTRTDRLFGFPDRPAVEACLAKMAQRDQPLVKVLARKPGQQAPRWVHLLGEAPAEAEPVPGVDRELVLADGAEERDAALRAAFDAADDDYADSCDSSRLKSATSKATSGCRCLASSTCSGEASNPVTSAPASAR